VGGSEAGTPWTLKSGGSSLAEVYAYGDIVYDIGIFMLKRDAKLQPTNRKS